jgi:hypothetical protein
MCFGKPNKPAPKTEEAQMTQVTRESELTPTGNVTYLTDGSEEREAEVRAAEEELARRVAEDKKEKERDAARAAEIAEAKARQEKLIKQVQDAAEKREPETERNIIETETKETPLDTSEIDKRLPDRPIGTSSVSYTTVVQQKPSEAAKEQEKLAAAELARARQERARQKQSLLRKRLERSAEYGSGKKVLTGEERELRGMREDARVTEATGKRRGTGRRSLIAGSRGGIGFYSRYS